MQLIELVAGIGVVVLSSLWLAREQPITRAGRSLLVVWGAIYAASAAFAYYAQHHAHRSLIDSPPDERNAQMAAWLTRSSNWLLVSRVVLALGFLAMMAVWARGQRGDDEVAGDD